MSFRALLLSTWLAVTAAAAICEPPAGGCGGSGLPGGCSCGFGRTCETLGAPPTDAPSKSGAGSMATPVPTEAYCADGEAIVATAATAVPTTSLLYSQCPSGHVSIMCEGQMIDPATGLYIQNPIQYYTDEFFAKTPEIQIEALPLQTLSCKVDGYTNTDGSDILLRFLVNSHVDVHQHETVEFLNIYEEVVCMHLSIMDEPGAPKAFLMDAVMASGGNVANVYSFQGPDASHHYGGSRITICTPEDPNTGIRIRMEAVKMCVSPCDGTLEGLVPGPVTTPTPTTLRPTLAPATLAPNVPDGGGMVCEAEGRGAMEANTTISDTFGTGGPKSNSATCAAGYQCVGTHDKLYGVELAQSKDFGQMTAGDSLSLTCALRQNGVLGDTTVDVVVTVVGVSDSGELTNFKFEILSSGYMITGGVVKSGKANTVFSWPICASDTGTPECCMGTDCGVCYDSDLIISGAPSYGGRLEAAAGTPLDEFCQGNGNNKVCTLKQQAMSHLNLCVAPVSEICPGSNCP